MDGGYSSNPAGDGVESAGLDGAREVRISMDTKSGLHPRGVGGKGERVSFLTGATCAKSRPGAVPCGPRTQMDRAALSCCRQCPPPVVWGQLSPPPVVNDWCTWDGSNILPAPYQSAALSG